MNGVKVTSAIAAFVAMFVLSFIWHEVLMGDYYAQILASVARAEPNLVLIGAGYLITAVVMAYVYPIPLSANVRETRSTQRIRVGRRQRKRTCWDCEREWKRMVVPLEPGRPSEARQLLRTRR